MVEEKKFFIIIVEDDLDDGEFMYKSFRKHGSFDKVIWTKNGKELFDLLKTGFDPVPDVILTDINMPVVNGLEVLEMLSKSPEFSRIPLFACSSTINPNYQKKCMDMGTKDFLVKPFDLFEYDHFPQRIAAALS
jgi:CheY-like chemotaxis protein